MLNLRNVVLTVFCLFYATASQPQRMQDTCCPHYFGEEEVRITGTVQSMERRTNQTRVSTTHLTLRADGKLYDVDLGPAKFMRRDKRRIEDGETVEVVCAPLNREPQENSRGMTVMIAKTVKVGERVMHLRDDEGHPKWRRRSAPNRH